MNKQKPLFVYDCDGTMCAPIVWAWALYKQDPNFRLSMKEFKEKNSDSSVALLPGISDLIQYTNQVGYNILLSGGDPSSHSNLELHSTFKYFKNWEFEDQKVAFGQEPESVHKTHPDIVKNLLKNFNPNRVVVFGDSEEEFILAQNFAKFIPTTFIFRGTPEKLFNTSTNISKYSAKDGYEMLEIVKILPKQHQRPSILTKYRIQNKTKVVKVLKEAPRKSKYNKTKKRLSMDSHLK